MLALTLVESNDFVSFLPCYNIEFDATIATHNSNVDTSACVQMKEDGVVKMHCFNCDVSSLQKCCLNSSYLFKLFVCHPNISKNQAKFVF